MTKKARYQEAIRALGLDVTYERFAEYCQEEYGFDVPKSKFYAAKREYKASLGGAAAEGVTPEEEADEMLEEPAEQAPPSAAPTKPAEPAAKQATSPAPRPTSASGPPKPAPAPADSGMIRLAELGELIEQARGLLGRFEGDKEALAKFIRVL